MKKLIKLFMVTIVTLSLTACSGEKKPVSNAAEIEVWLTPQWKGVFSQEEAGADYDSFLKEAAKRFNEVNPDVKVNVQVISGEERADKLSVAIQTKTLPDIFFDSSFALSEYAHMGVLAPIDDIIDEASKTDIPESIWDNVQIDGKTYFYPFGHNPGTLVYNAEMFEAAGLDAYIAGEHEIATWTLEEYETILATLKDKLEVDPMGLFAVNNQGDTWNMSWLRMFGNPYFTEDGLIATNEETGVKALAKLDEWRTKGYTNNGAESLSSNDVNAMFQNQQVAVSFTNSILFSNILNDMEAGNVEPFDARLANIPGETNPVSFTYVTSSVVFNTGDETKMNAAKEFVKFYSSDEDLVLASKNTLPVRDSVTPKVADELPYSEAYGKNAGHIINFSNNTAGYAELRNALFPELQAVFVGDKTPQEAMDSFKENGDKIIETNKEKSVILK